VNKNFLLVLLILNLRGFPQSDAVGSDYPPIENQSTEIIISEQSEFSKTALLKYSVSLFNFSGGQTGFKQEYNTSLEDVSTKSPWLAFGLSLFYPGLGQLYNAEYGKALLMGGLGTFGLGLAMLAAMSTDFDSESNPDYIGVMLNSGVAIWGGTYIWSLIDAPIAAGNINEQRSESGLSILSFNDGKFAVKINLSRGFSYNALEFLISF
jgi:hypothetical protein